MQPALVGKTRNQISSLSEKTAIACQTVGHVLSSTLGAELKAKIKMVN